MDSRLRIEVLRKTPDPQQLVWLSAHQCVCEGAAIDDHLPSEEKAGEYVVKHLLAGGRGHYSPLEAPQISFSVVGFNHRTMQQIRTHRIGVHFSVQSFRYSGDRFAEVGRMIQSEENFYDLLKNQTIVDALEDLYYLRPVGTYTDRKTGAYEYTPDRREKDLLRCGLNTVWYASDIDDGKSHEQSAGCLLMDARQNWVMSFNIRSLMHVLDLRSRADSQLEIQWLCNLVWPHFEAWVPALASWYKENRWGKARLSP